MRINKGPISKKASQVKAPEQAHQGLVNFSFKYLDLSHDKFGIPNTVEKHSYLAMLFDRLKHVSSMTCHEFRQAGKVLRSHQIDWARTTEPNGFTHLSEQLQDCQPWQFSLAREELGRIHGFWVAEVFYAVWIDHEHALFAGR
jgi:hypothetical protein